MLVRFKDNLGSMDAERHGLDYRLCQGGMEAECDDRTGALLVAKNLAAEVPSKPIRAVPAPPAISEAKAPEIKAVAAEPKPETKPAPLAKASRNKSTADQE